MNRIPIEIRSSIRFFAFYVGNGTLGSVFNEFPDYTDFLDGGSFLSSLVAVFLNSLDLNDQKSVGLSQRLAWQYVKSQLNHEFVPDPQYGNVDTDPKLHDDYRQNICEFARHLELNTIPRSQNDGVDYWTSGSGLESMFAVYCNVAELDSESKVSNHEIARDRVDTMVDSDDIVLEDWETELH